MGLLGVLLAVMALTARVPAEAGVAAKRAELLLAELAGETVGATAR
jgi:hypothetical protein